MEEGFKGDDLEKRKAQAINFLKEKKDWIVYLLLAFLVWLGMFIRTRNIGKLKDITTGDWILGPDLDPFLFLRWAKDIVANGSLFALDAMRSVPLAEICSGVTCNPINTAGEMKLLSYMIAWFYQLISFFSKEVTVTYAAIWFPVIMFGLTTIAFFLFSRKIFYKEDKITRNVIALISTTFFILIPSLLPRTIAGIPEKESAAFFFIFMAFYLFLEAFTAKNFKKGLMFGVLAGISTALLGLTWGGSLFVFFTIPAAFLLAFIFGKIDKEKFFIYGTWMITSFVILMYFSARYTLKILISSTSTGAVIGIFAIVGFSLLIMKTNKLDRLRRKTRLPKEIFSLILSTLILFMIVLIILGPGFILGKISSIQHDLITPITTRFGLTVAENKQPFYMNDWKNSFGPVVFDIPLFFWLFFMGSVLLFNHLIRKLKKGEKIILTFGYLIFLICLIFSKYSSASIFNGTNGISIFVYFGGWIILLGAFVKIYHQRFKDGNYMIFREFDFSYLLYFVVLTLGIIGARSGIRLIMVLGAVSPIAVAFLIVKISQRYFKEKDDLMKFIVAIIAILIIVASIFTVWTYYQQDKYTAENFAPGVYQFQWQKAMSWVRENTSSDAVFAHWWDYGYWVQSIGERSTILDGGNAIVYWNHLMGRHVLTGTDEQEALNFLYSHNGTHLLIDSTEIGKYTAYSSIGADENYDRFSWISTFMMNDAQTRETKNETIYVYTGGTSTDEDIVWKDEEKEIFLPGRKTGVGAIILTKELNGDIKQPEGVFVYNNQQYNIPLRYIYFEDKLYDFGTGLDAGAFIFPRIDNSNGQLKINEIGTALYLSPRTVHSRLADLYLFNQNSKYFSLVHAESNFVVENLRSQNIEIGEFVYYQGFQGPINIWEISYPSGMEVNPAYLELDYPDKELSIAKTGEY